MGGSPEATSERTTTQRTELPPEIKPFLMRGLQSSEAAFLDAPTDTQSSDLTRRAASALGGLSYPGNISSPGLDAIRQTAQGDFLTGGQGFDSAYEAARRRILPDIQQSFALAGQPRSALAQDTASRALGEAFTGILGQERQNQLQAAQLYPSLLDTLRQQDLARQSFGAQQQLTEADLLRMLERDPERRATGFLSNLAGSPLPSVSTQTTPLFQNKTAGMLGGAIKGAGAGAGAGPWGALAGGVIGGIMGRQ